MSAARRAGALVGRRWRQLLRYGAVSVVATLTSQVVLAVLVTTRWASPGWANVAATAAGTVPSFELNRVWVWGRRGRRGTGEVGAFWALSFAGLALSTLAVVVTARWTAHTGIDGAARTVTLQLANLTAFGSLWVAQFVLLDRVLFATRARHAS